MLCEKLAHTAHYDALIQQYLQEDLFPKEISFGYTLHPTSLRYGENPHQQATVYRASTVEGKQDPFSLLDCRVLQGKQLSFNNLGDTFGAIDTLREFSETACVVVKHATPCGVSIAKNSIDALTKAFEADKLSAFGGIVALNHICDAQ